MSGRRVLLGSFAVVILLATVPSVDAGLVAGNFGLKGMSKFPGGSGLAGVWREQYNPDGSRVPNFGAVETAGDGRFVNAAGSDVDGDGNQEVLMAFNPPGPLGIYMIDIDSAGNAIPGTFAAITVEAGSRRMDVAAGDMGKGGGDIFVLDVQTNLGGPSGIYRLKTTTAGGIAPGSFSKILDLPSDELFSAALVDVDNDQTVELLLGRHFGTVDFSEMRGSQIQLLMFKTTEDGVVGGLSAFNDGLGAVLESWNFTGIVDGAWLGLGGGDVDNDGVFEGVAVTNRVNNGVYTSGPGVFFEVTGNAWTNLVPFDLDDTNRRTDPGVTGLNVYVPEPSSVVLVGVGVIGLFGFIPRRMRRRDT